MFLTNHSSAFLLHDVRVVKNVACLSSLVSCLVLEIFRFFERCKLRVSNVIYSRIVNYIYKIVNISVNNEQKSFKLCMSFSI